MDFDSGKALDHVLAVLKSAADVRSGMESLFTYCEAAEPASPLWQRLRRLDYGADATAMAIALERLLRDPRISPDHTGFYFGLDGLNMRQGKGVEFGCSRRYDPALPGVRWVYECDLYPSDLPSDALRELYSSGVQLASLADYVVCFGYLGLALRHALEMLPPATLLGGAPHRALMWGFHDGDLAILGVVKPSGFERWACFDPDPDATEAFTPTPLPGTSLGRYFAMRQAFSHPQWVLEADEEAGLHWLDLYPPGLAQQASLNRPVPLRVQTAGPRVPLSTLFMHGNLPVADADAACLLRQVAPHDMQILPARVRGEAGEYFLVHASHEAKAEQRLESGHLVLLVDAVSAAGRHIFRTTESLSPVVSARLKEAIDSAGFKSRWFQPVLSVP